LQAHDDLIVVGAVEEGEEALVQALSLHPDVVLVDLTMPNLSGLEVIPRLRRMLPETAIIALTLHNTDAYRHAALTAGADDFISKGGMSADLLPAIRRVVHRDTQDEGTHVR
jgi:DNA-binding NarL/FixJ family response regulator